MKRSSQFALLFSCTCLVSGVGTFVFPQIQAAMAASVPVEPVPSATSITRPDATSPRFEVIEVNADLPMNYFQPLLLNDRGNILAVAEDRKEEITPGLNDRPRRRLRVLKTQYLLFEDGKFTPIQGVQTAETNYFRPLAMNDNGEVLFLQFKAFSDDRNSGKSYLHIWSDGKMQQTDVATALKKAGSDERALGLVEYRGVSFNNRGEILFGLQSLFLWSGGQIKVVGAWSLQNGERVFMNNTGTIVRRADQFRTAADGQTVYPLAAVYPQNQPRPIFYDFGPNTMLLDLNTDDSVLVRREHTVTNENFRTQFLQGVNNQQKSLFVVEGRTLGRSNSRGQVVAWRAPDSNGWDSWMFNPTRVANSIPVYFDGKRLFDLTDLLPADQEKWQIQTVHDINERGEILVQARQGSIVRTLLLRPTQS